MSGPIVRKYGFPNFEKIFGERALQHGVEDETTPAATEAVQPAEEPKASKARPKKAPAKAPKKKS